MMCRRLSTLLSALDVAMRREILKAACGVLRSALDAKQSVVGGLVDPVVDHTIDQYFGSPALRRCPSDTVVAAGTERETKIRAGATVVAATSPR